MDQGGTGVTTKTGTGNVVLSSSPTIVTPTIASFTNATHNHSNSAGGGQITLGSGTTGNYVATAVAGAGIGVSGATGNVTITADTAATNTAGIAELATNAETVTGTDTGRVVTPDGLTDKMAAPGTIGGTTPAAATFTTLTATGQVNFTGGATITNVTSSNLVIGDAFAFFATGSAGTNIDSGFIVQSGSADLSGSAIYHEKAAKRWAVAKGVSSIALAVTPL